MEIIFKRIGAAFVHWYNTKYDRVGHLFQSRFTSEPVNTESYYLTALRYIVRNPVSAGLCRFPQEYRYGSGPEYIDFRPGITDTENTFSLISKSDLKAFLIADNKDQCLDIDQNYKRLSNQSAMELILREFGTMTPLSSDEISQQDLGDSIKKLIKKGLSIRQLHRLTGISRRKIEKYRL